MNNEPLFKHKMEMSNRATVGRVDGEQQAKWIAQTR